MSKSLSQSTYCLDFVMCLHWSQWCSWRAVGGLLMIWSKQKSTHNLLHVDLPIAPIYYSWTKALSKFVPMCVFIIGLHWYWWCSWRAVWGMVGKKWLETEKISFQRGLWIDSLTNRSMVLLYHFEKSGNISVNLPNFQKIWAQGLEERGGGWRPWVKFIQMLWKFVDLIYDGNDHIFSAATS